jgi:hypothetical protein
MSNQGVNSLQTVYREWMPSKDPAILKRHRDRWYADNKATQIARQMVRRRELKDWLLKYKQERCCADCGMSFADRPECADFHHLDPSIKEGPVYRFTVSSRAAMLAEIAKCVLLCANCHRTRHRQAPSESN